MGSARIPGARRSASLAAACTLAALLVFPAGAVHAAADEPSPTPEPVRIPPISMISVGDAHGCALVQGGDVWCSGSGYEGQLGNGTMDRSDLPVRAQLPRPAVAIEAGGNSSCAITDDGAAWCWGDNEYGQLGNGTTVGTAVPTQVDLPGPAVALAFGTDWHACALLDDGSGWCWGHDDFGQLGDGKEVDKQPSPVRVTVVDEPIRQISPGFLHTCALLRSGAIACWGVGSSGELGDGARGYPDGAVTVKGISGAVEAIAASYGETCAVVDGRVLCWGGNEEGRLGTATGNEFELTPTPVTGLPGDIAEITTSESGGHICARTRDGATWCWGNAEVGQLGEGVPVAPAWVATPVRLDLPRATAISAGYSNVCALFAPDDLRCWGSGDPVARNPWTGATGPTASGFREPGPLVPTITTYIPTPRDVSTDPPVVGANLVLAALVMILFTIAGELLNRTLAQGEDVLAAQGGMLARARRLRARLDAGLARRLGHGRRLAAVQLAGIAAIYGLVFSLLDRTWNPLSVTGIWLFLSMAVAFGVVGIADDLACWSVARRWGVAADLDLRPGNLVVAMTSTFASRVAFLVPGVMIGMPEALDVDVDALDARRRARLAGVGLGTLVVVGLAAWGVTLGTSLAAGMGEGAATVVGGIQAFFLVVFAVTVQNGFAQMLAFRGTPGRTLRTSHRWLWLAGLLGVTFLFWHTLVNPRGDLATALQETNVVVFVATAAGFVLFAAAVWLWFALQRRRAAGTARGGRVPATVGGTPAEPLPLATAPSSLVAAPVVGTLVPATPAPDGQVPVAAAPGPVEPVATTLAPAPLPGAPAPLPVAATAFAATAAPVAVATPPPDEVAVTGTASLGAVATLPAPTACPPAPSFAGPLATASPTAGRVVAEIPPAYAGWVAPGAPAPIAGVAATAAIAGVAAPAESAVAAAPAGLGPVGQATIGTTSPPVPAPTASAPGPAVEFELRAIGDRRLHGNVRLVLHPAEVILAGTWTRARADRIERRAGILATVLLLLGLGAILGLTTIPGFRFYRVPWLIPTAVGVASAVAVAVLLLRVWRARQRWSGQVAVPAEMIVGVRTALDRGPLVAACILLTPIGGAIYAAVVGPKVVRLRGPFDPERTSVLEVRLKCRDRDEASDVAARVAAIRGAVAPPTGGWR